MEANDIVRQMNGWELFWSRMYLRLRRFDRHFPRLVWPNDEVDVVVTFTADRLPPVQGEDIQAMLREARRELLSGPIAEIEHQLSRLGVGFDKGMGPDGRDWEWDWSLSGPISVRFRRRTKKPMRRTGMRRARLSTAQAPAVTGQGEK